MLEAVTYNAESCYVYNGQQELHNEINLDLVVTESKRIETPSDERMSHLDVFPLLDVDKTILSSRIWKANTFQMLEILFPLYSGAASHNISVIFCDM